MPQTSGEAKRYRIFIQKLRVSHICTYAFGSPSEAEDNCKEGLEDLLAIVQYVITSDWYLQSRDSADLDIPKAHIRGYPDHATKCSTKISTMSCCVEKALWYVAESRT